MTEFYVKRERQREIVKARLCAMQNGKEVNEPIIEWYGVPGIGKTTLTERVIADLCQQENIPYARIDFDVSKKPKANRAYKETPVFILEDLGAKLNTYYKFKPTHFHLPIDEYLDATDVYLRKERESKVLKSFLDYIAALIDQVPIVLAFDTTEKIHDREDKLVKWIEENILRPLTLNKKTLIIWTGRVKQHWYLFEVRCRVKSFKLNPFDLEATREQSRLYGQLPNNIDIHSITFGHPLANKVLFQLLAENPQVDKQCLINQAYRVVNEEIMSDIDNDLSQAFEVLSAVRQFDISLAGLVLSKVAYFEGQKLFTRIVGRLAKTPLAGWDRERSGYILDETIRYILVQYLRVNQPETYLGLNEVAAKLYEDRIRTMPGNRNIYLLEWIYHQLNVGIFKGIPLNKLIKDLETELYKYLQDYYHNGSYKECLFLCEELEKDKELRYLLNDYRLSELIKNHINALRKV